jgi:hypothetical protein
MLLQVSGFTVARPNYGSIRWLPPVDVRGLKLDEIVTIGQGEFDGHAMVYHVHCCSTVDAAAAEGTASAVW